MRLGQCAGNAHDDSRPALGHDAARLMAMAVSKLEEHSAPPRRLRAIGGGKA